MLAGVIAGLLAFCLARMVGEREVDRSISFEAALAQAHGEAPEPEMISRGVQRGVGLLTGTVVYGAALGGIFGLVYAFAQGRVAVARPRSLAALLAGGGFLSVALAPALKYPANPPAVGNPETIGLRTAAYFLMLALSVATLGLGLQVQRRLAARMGAWNASLFAIAMYVAMLALWYKLLPAIDEVPDGFPASLLWRFRVDSLGMQAVLWGAIGLGFGWLAERDLAASAGTAWPGPRDTTVLKTQGAREG